MKQIDALSLQLLPTRTSPASSVHSAHLTENAVSAPKGKWVASWHDLGYSSGKTHPQLAGPRENKKLMKPAEGSTVIGKSVIIRGEVSGSEDLYIDGDVEGTVTLAENRLTIGPNARVRADIHVREVVVFGHLTGNVQATGRVDLRQSALVKGDILAGRLSIEESAVLTGRVELKATAEAAKPSAPVAVAPAPAEANTTLFSQPKA
jgi:cytoskeletal protein CcmA (bactofilin family)